MEPVEDLGAEDDAAAMDRLGVVHPRGWGGVNFLSVEVDDLGVVGAPLKADGDELGEVAESGILLRVVPGADAVHVIPDAEAIVVSSRVGAAVEEFGRVDFIAAEGSIEGDVPVGHVHTGGGGLGNAQAGLMVAEFLAVAGTDAALGPVCLVFQIFGSGGADGHATDVGQPGAQAAATDGDIGAKDRPHAGVERGAVEVIGEREDRVVLWFLGGGCPGRVAGDELDGIGHDVLVRAVVADDDAGGGAGFGGDVGDEVPDTTIDFLVHGDRALAVGEDDIDRCVGGAVRIGGPAEIDVVVAAGRKGRCEGVGGGRRGTGGFGGINGVGAVGTGDVGGEPVAGDGQAGCGSAGCDVVEDHSRRRPNAAGSGAFAGGVGGGDGVVGETSGRGGGVGEGRGRDGP